MPESEDECLAASKQSAACSGITTTTPAPSGTEASNQIVLRQNSPVEFIDLLFYVILSNVFRNRIPL